MSSSWFFLLPIALGSASVLQAALNREVAVRLGLGQAVFVNNLVFFFFGILLFWSTHRFPHYFPELYRPKDEFSAIKLWYLLPGLLGFFLVSGAPFAISKLGSFFVFVLLIAAQMTVSLVWDRAVGGIEITSWRWVGAVITILGAWISTRT